MGKTAKMLGQGTAMPIEVEQYLYESVSVEPEAIEEDLIRVSSDVAYWNERHAVAHRAHLVAKLDAERDEARLTLEHRECLSLEWQETVAKAAKEGVKAPREPTVDAVRAAVLTDPLYRAARLAEIECEAERARLRGVVSAVESKKDAVQSICATRRLEMTGDPLLRNVRRQA
jgi:hypothetical protein